MTRTVRDAAALLQVLAGPDPRDPVALQDPVPDYSAGIEDGVRGLRIGFDESYATEGVAPEVSAAVSAGLDVLVDAGAELVALRVPPMQDVLRVWTLVCAADAAVAHRDTFPAQADRYGPAFRSVLEAGARVTGTDYAQAQEHARVFSGRLRECFDRVDVIACPSFFAPAPPLALMDLSDADAVVPELLRFTGPYDFSGSPSISLPAGFSEDGLPVSLQLIGRHLEEALLLRAGLSFESATPFHERHPSL
jgi:amidase